MTTASAAAVAATVLRAVRVQSSWGSLTQPGLTNRGEAVLVLHAPGTTPAQAIAVWRVVWWRTYGSAISCGVGVMLALCLSSLTAWPAALIVAAVVGAATRWAAATAFGRRARGCEVGETVYLFGVDLSAARRVAVSSLLAAYVLTVDDRLERAVSLPAAARVGDGTDPAISPVVACQLIRLGLAIDAALLTGAADEVVQAAHERLWAEALGAPA